ncbi:MAG: hypothetical protein D6775_08850 [Caldilineae bacterium]|nr:MAG: hypothetical protein D6775_08850 [Caldilineae bacterium]
MPQRYFYAGPAFRYEEPRAGRQREFWQAGIELIGADGPDADAEVLAFAATALAQTELEQVRFTLGHLGYFHGLIEHLQLQPAQVEELQSALDRKSKDDLSAFVHTLDLAPEDRATLLGLLELSGRQGEGVLARAAALARNQKMAGAVKRLVEVEARLDHYGVKHLFLVDLADVRGMNYYTGITFKAYTLQMGSAIVNGGRYDNLIGHFGPSRPAVGCAFYLDRILLARARQYGPPPDPRPDLLIHPCPCGTYVRLLEAARTAGYSAALALGPESPDPSIPDVYCTCTGSVRILESQGELEQPLEEWLASLSDS